MVFSKLNKYPVRTIIIAFIDSHKFLTLIMYGPILNCSMQSVQIDHAITQQ